MTQFSPREITTPFRPIPLDVPEGMKPNKFFNGTENLNDLMHNNGLLINPENLLLYRRAWGMATSSMLRLSTILRKVFSIRWGALCGAPRCLTTSGMCGTG